MFNGLLPELHNTRVQLLFLCSHWHGLAKLWIHTNLTLVLLDNIIAFLCNKLQYFKEETCTYFVETQKLPRKAAAKVHYTAKKTSQQGLSTLAQPGENISARQPKTFNLNTYKIYAIGNYSLIIYMYGTTDLYSTERVSCVLILSKVFMLTMYLRSCTL